MNENNSSRHKDAENKLDKYRTINKKISKKLTAKRMEITELRKILLTSTADIINVRTECRKWKCKVLKMRDIHIDQTRSTTIETQKCYPEEMGTLLNECITEMDRYLATPIPVSFKYTRRIPKKPIPKRVDMGTIIDEESDPENSLSGNDDGESDVNVESWNNAPNSLRFTDLHFLEIVNETCGINEKADVDAVTVNKTVQNRGENKENSEDRLHIVFHSVEESDGSSDQVGNKFENMPSLKKNEDDESLHMQTIASALRSRPKRNVNTTDFLRF